MATKAPQARRIPAEERRGLILDAARSEFARLGLYGASTREIAAAAGISQPYLFQHFETKKDLFLAVLDASFERVLASLRVAGADLPREAVFTEISRAYIDQLEGDSEGLMLFNQFVAACGDDAVRERLVHRFGELYHYVERVSGANEEAVRTLFAYGMLATLAASLRLDDLPPQEESWAARLLGFLGALSE